MSSSGGEIILRLSIGSFVGSIIGSCIWVYSIYNDSTPTGSANVAKRQETAQAVIAAEVEHHRLRVREAELKLERQKLEVDEDQRARERK